VTVGDLSNRWRGRRWRELVALQLQADGIETATPRALSRSASAFADDGPRPDIEGVPGIHLDAAAASFAAMGSYLDAATSAADLAGQGRIPALALYRQRRPASESYAVLRLSDFALLVLAANST
jgi:hypothetical protein